MMKLKFFVKAVQRWFSQLRHKLRIKVLTTTRTETSKIIKRLEEEIMLEMSDQEAKELRKQLSKCKTIEEQKRILAEKGVEFTFGPYCSLESQTAEKIIDKEEQKDDNQGPTTENK